MLFDKVVWAYLSTIITLVGYGIYIKQMLTTSDSGKSRVRPHPLTWSLFGFLTCTGWLVQVAQGGGPGSWCLGITSAACFLIASISWRKFQWKFSKRNWCFVILACIPFFFSLWTRHIAALATVSAILATAAGLASYEPMISKCWKDPHSDSAINLIFNSVKCIPALLALRTYTWSTTIYLVMLFFVNGGFAAVLICRRKYVPKSISV
jgi:hypothetical protein